MISIEHQIARMGAIFSRWQPNQVDRQTVEWSGSLTPNRQTYEIKINAIVPTVLEYHELLWLQPLVEITYPKLRELEGNKEGSLPHVYWKHPRKAGGPFLCLFDADARQWTQCDYIADTTIPWTSFWLDFYEGWLATGIWLGPGRHQSQGAATNASKEKIGRNALHAARATWLGSTRFPYSLD